MSVADTDRRGEIITFYSYKGGTGRTMALANIACLLATRERGDVLMVDWDLEAPGLHRFFAQMVSGDEASFDAQPGLLDMFDTFHKRARRVRKPLTEDQARQLIRSVDLDEYVVPCSLPSLFLMKAGRFDGAYATRVNAFRWELLYGRAPSLIPEFVELLTERYRYVLVDSRTGLTDSSGICTMLLPEKLVVVFTPTRQSLTGIIDLVGNATTYRRESDDLRPLVVFPLVSRVDLSEEDLRKQWRYGDLLASGYQRHFEELFRSAYDLPECDLEDYFNEVQIQHVARYAYGEDIAVLHERTGDRLSLSRSYANFFDRLIELKAPWLTPAPDGSLDLVPFINRQSELTLFQRLLESEKAPWILMIHDAAGAGKTMLLRRFAELCRVGDVKAAAAIAPLGGVPAGVTPASPRVFLELVVAELTAEGVAFPRFEKLVAADAATSELGAAGGIELARVVDPHPERVLHAFIADLGAAGERMIIILVDDFDAAPSALQAWLVDSFIAQLSHLHSAGLVVAGRVVPPDLEKRVPHARVWSIDRLSAFSRDDIAAFFKLNGVELGDDDISFFERQLVRGVGIVQLAALVRAYAESEPA